MLETDMGIAGLAQGRAAIRRPDALLGAEPAIGRRAFRPLDEAAQGLA